MSGCDADHYKPLNINGWFWASTLVKVQNNFHGNFYQTIMTIMMFQMLPTNRPIGLNPDGVRVSFSQNHPHHFHPHLDYLHLHFCDDDDDDD